MVTFICVASSVMLPDDNVLTVRLHQGEEESVPEEVGRQAAKALFEEISRGGVADSAHQVHIYVQLSSVLQHFVCIKNPTS